MPVPMPVLAMAMIGGAAVIAYGVRDTKAALAANTAATTTSSSTSSVTDANTGVTAPVPSASGAGGGVAVGAVTYGDLNTLASAHGWTAGEVADWVQVIIDESGGELTAQNPTSSAYGIAQFIDGAGEYAQYGGNSTTVMGQLTAMANYIAQRYGSPSAALAHENSAHWY